MIPNVNLHLVNFLLKLFHHLTKCYLHRNHNFNILNEDKTYELCNTLSVKAMADFILSNSWACSIFSIIKCIYLLRPSCTQEAIVWLYLSCRISYLLFSCSGSLLSKVILKTNHEGTSSTDFLLLQLITLYLVSSAMTAFCNCK